MGTGTIDDTAEVPAEVLDFHKQYREVLHATIDGYVFDNQSSSLYLLVSKPNVEEYLRDCFRDVDYNIGILHIPKEEAAVLGTYESFDDVDRKCA